MGAAGAVDVTDIVPNGPSRELTIIFVDGNITLKHSAALLLKGAADKTGAANSVIQLVCDGATWYQSAELIANA